MNILLLTSCNRIKQTLLSLSLNAQTIKGLFSIIIVDNSTPGVEANQACDRHQGEDPYNVVKPHNYCSDTSLLYDMEQYLPSNVEQYKVIHTSPRLTKQRGEATSVALGLMQAALMGERHYGRENYCLKITGTSILKYDLLSEIPSRLENAGVVTWHRANIGGQERSTRVFGCRPDELVSHIAKEGWSNWCDDATGIFEQRFAEMIIRTLGQERVNYTRNDENGLLLEGSVAMHDSYARERITQFIKENNIDVNASPYLNQFMQGHIWP
jgi:hypothetical protein